MASIWYLLLLVVLGTISAMWPGEDYRLYWGCKLGDGAIRLAMLCLGWDLLNGVTVVPVVFQISYKI